VQGTQMSRQSEIGFVIHPTSNNIVNIIIDSLMGRLRAFKRQKHSDTESLRSAINSTVIVHEDGSTVNIGQQVIDKFDKSI
jgi:hypothetical protein